MTLLHSGQIFNSLQSQTVRKEVTAITNLKVKFGSKFEGHNWLYKDTIKWASGTKALGFLTVVI